MKIYDITQELFSCEVYPGDPEPKKEELCSIAKGDVCNLTSLSLCAHNGTHIDAPYHFYDNGKTIDQIPLEKLVGYCSVADHNGIVTADDARAIIKNANGIKKILIKGDATVSLEAAEVFADAEIELLGNESQTVGPKDAPMAVHKVLLAKEIILLEGIRLSHVPCGKYLLNCAPINLGGCDGAPCRATLISL